MDEDERVNVVKKIALTHYVYMIVLFVLVVILILALEFGGSGRAGENLNFAATLASIILAVIAILYTLFDSSSQKKNAENIRKSVKELKGYSEDFKDQIKESRQFNSELLSKFVELEEWRKQVKEEIESKTNNVENVDEVKKYVNEILNRKVEPDSDRFNIQDSLIIKIMNEQPDKDYWLSSQLHRKLTQEYGINVGRAALRFQLDNMVRLGAINKILIGEGSAYSLMR
jgi:hypothetical protein